MSETVPSLDLRPDHRAIVRDILCRHVSDRYVLAFGSRANWTAKEYSDLDLAVLGDEPLPFDLISALSEDFGESDLPFKVDLIDWARIDQTFRDAIRRDGVVVQGSDNDHADPATKLTTPILCGNFDIADTWVSLPIEAIGEVVGGSTPSTRNPRNFDGDVPWLTPRDLSSTHDRWVSRGERNLSQRGLEACSAKLVPMGAVLLTNRAPIGYVALAASPIATNQGFRSIIVRSQYDPEFLYYWLKANTEKLERYATGSTFRELSGSALKRISVLLPESRAEQRAIANILGTLDDKIELNRRMNETLEAMAQAIFKDWFVDFGPTRAKSEGRPPYLVPKLWDLFPNTLDDEDKPAGWENKPLDEIAEFLNGLALQKFPASDANDSLPVIKIAELRRGVTEKSNRASRLIPDKYVVEDGDFLFSWSGSLLTRFWTEGRGALNQHLFKVTSDRYPEWFFSQWVRHHLGEFRAIAASKATTMGHIQRRHLKDAVTCCPPDNVLSDIGQMIGPLVGRSTKNSLENRTLSQVRDFLLPKLMSGDIGLVGTEVARESVARVP